jgi:hypothetical protein
VVPAGQFSIHAAELVSVAARRPSPLPPEAPQGLVYLRLVTTGAGMIDSASVGGEPDCRRL